MNNFPEGLTPYLSSGSQVVEISPRSWRLTIPAGPAGRYRLAQIDNYHMSKRRDFPHSPPLSIKLEARTSGSNLPGTWGFGLWNDPFAMGRLVGKDLRLPALPNTSWFFYASPENYLSLRDEIPPNGYFAGVFRSRLLPGWLVAPGILAMALALAPTGAGMLRSLGRKILHQAGAACRVNPQDWHEYHLQWLTDGVQFWVDGERLLITELSPQAPLGLVIWIDNQYAALPPGGRLRYGMLANPEPAWIEVRGLEIRR